MLAIRTYIPFKQYLKLIAGLTYRKPMMILILFVDALMLTWIILDNLKVYWVPEITIFQYFTVIIITVIQPMVVYSIIRRNYFSSAHLMEPLEIDFTTDLIKLSGNSFYTELKWNKIFKVKELNNWFIIYQNTINAIIIPKSAFTNHQRWDFKTLLQSIPKLNLKLHRHVHSGF